MNTIYQFLAIALIICTPFCAVNAQDTLLSENFEGSTYELNLNTTTFGANPNGYNSWVINNSYQGGTGSIVDCLFQLPLSFSIPFTGSQPMTISGAPQSSYMHIVSDSAQADGVSNANFLAADGLCYGNESYSAEMNADINTQGYSGVTLSFYWICGGGTGISGNLTTFGQVIYSTDGGQVWQNASPNVTYANQTGWTQTSISISDFDNQSQLRFAFRFVNGLVVNAFDPGFGIDEVVITGNPLASANIDSVMDLRFCSSGGGSTFLSYTTQGTYQPGNQFTAELSSESGDFSSPFSIGQFQSSGSGMFQLTIPGGLTPGNGYRVRLVSSAPNAIADTLDELIVLDEVSFAGLAVSEPASPCMGDTVSIWAPGSIGDLQWDFLSGAFPALTGDTINFGPVMTNEDVVLIARSGVCPPDTAKSVSIQLDQLESSFTYTVFAGTYEVAFFEDVDDATSFSWTFDSLGGALASSTSFVFPGPGTYEVCLEVENDNGCSSQSCQMIELSPLSSLDRKVEKRIHVWPNPASDELKIDLSEISTQSSQLRVTNMLGQTLYLHETNQKFLQIDIQSWTPGLYILSIENSQGAETIQWWKK